MSAGGMTGGNCGRARDACQEYETPQNPGGAGDATLARAAVVSTPEHVGGDRERLRCAAFCAVVTRTPTSASMSCATMTASGETRT
jgi:hypothetical protein